MTWKDTERTVARRLGAFRAEVTHTTGDGRVWWQRARVLVGFCLSPVTHSDIRRSVQRGKEPTTKRVFVYRWRRYAAVG